MALIALFGAGSAAVLFAVSLMRSDAWRTRRVLRRTRVTPIAELVDGKLQCVVGTVELDAEPLVAMVSKRTCVAYDTTVQFFQGTDFTVPVRVEVERRLVSFFVVDETGRARVEAPEAALCNRPIARSERYEERIIEPGARVRLVGSVVVEAVVSASEHHTAPREHGFRETATKATIIGSTKYPLLIDVE